MAFILPLLPLIASGVGGFTIGYIANGNSVQNKSEHIVLMDTIKFDEHHIDTNILRQLNQISPHKELKHELIHFDKNTLKRSKQQKPYNTDSIIINDLRKKILQRRNMLGL